jgi:hypothetical protein
MRAANVLTKYQANSGRSSERWRRGGRQIGKYVEPVEQVGAKAPFSDHFLQVAVGGRDNSHIDSNGPAISQPFEFMLLEDARQFGLQLKWQVANLVQIDGPSICHLKAARRLRHGARKRAPLVAE